MSSISKFKSFNLFFLVIFVLNILFLFLLTDYRIVAKPMIMASLIGLYISQEKRQSNSFTLALIFALFGDAFLLFKSDDFFIIGLGCFLIMQILYILNFLNDRSQDLKRLIVVTGIVALINGLFLYLFWNDFGDLKIPVVMYSLAISGMVISAIIRKKEHIGYQNIVIGVILFLISDTVLGISKFGSPFYGHDIAVISTYMIAQYLIVTGMLLKNAD